jgi:hypothetical protein
MLVFNPSSGELDLIREDGIGLAGMGVIAWSAPDARRGTPIGAIGGQFGRVRFAYLTTGADGLDLDVRSSIGTITLGEFPAKAVLAGSEPAGLVAVSLPNATGAGDQTESEIYVIDPIRRTGMAEPALEGLAPGAVPLVLQLEGGQASSVVFCLAPSEGSLTEDDLCFGLYRADLASGDIDQLASDDLAIVALSPDARVAALASQDRIPPEVHVRSLDTGTEVVLRSEPGERQVRRGALSPAGTRLAWSSAGEDEAGGGSLTLNLVSASGGPVTRLGSATLSEAIGDQVFDVQPVGWLDEGRLLLELSTSRTSALYVLELDDGRIDHVAPGRLAGFVYR